MGTEDLIAQLDPEIARQMGFTSFGGAKRRKLATADDAVTDVESSRHEPPPRDANGEEIIPGGYNDPNLPPGLGIYGTRAVPGKSTHQNPSSSPNLTPAQLPGRPRKRRNVVGSPHYARVSRTNAAIRSTSCPASLRILGRFWRRRGSR